MIQSVKNICSSISDQQVLQLFNDKCFKIVDKDKTSAEFCMDNFVVPVDGHSCISIGVDSISGEFELFDNNILTTGSPSIDLVQDSTYVRGILLMVEYPNNDEDGEEINISDKSVEIWIEDAKSLQWKQYSMYNFFSIFSNPKSNNPEDLINRIKIVHSSSEFDVSIKALITYGKVQ